MSIGIAGANVTSYGQIVSSDGSPVTTADPTDPQVCVVNSSFLAVAPSAVCPSGSQLSLLGFTPPSGATVHIEYLTLPP